MILSMPCASSASMVGCRIAASAAMSLTSSPMTSTPPVEEMLSTICVVAPTTPIFSPFSLMIVAGAIFLPMPAAGGKPV